MPNESGDLKLLANFRKLIDLVSADTDFKPSNAALKPTWKRSPNPQIEGASVPPAIDE